MIPFFFLKDRAPPENYTLPLHDALPIARGRPRGAPPRTSRARAPPAGPRRTHRRWSRRTRRPAPLPRRGRSEEHTSELQSRQYLVCRLLLEKTNWQTCTPKTTPTDLSSP